MSFFSNIFSKAKPLSLNGMTDWHCHILPGVDDGVETMPEALDILKYYELMGISEVWLTPHIMEDIPNQTGKLKLRFQELKAAYHGTVKLNLASENMIDNLFLERLESDDLLPIGEYGKILLVETSYFNAPMKFQASIEAIKSKGYFPLLAHPERYNYIDSLTAYRELKDMGVQFQLNLMSLSGYYGVMVKEKAHQLLTAGMYDRIGSDLHRKEHIDILQGMQLKQSVLDRINRI